MRVSRGYFLDAFPHLVWDALEFGEAWNGWATPVVERDVLITMLTDCGWSVCLEGAMVIAVDPDDDALAERFAANAQGHFDLGQLGWTFVRCETE